MPRDAENWDDTALPVTTASVSYVLASVLVPFNVCVSVFNETAKAGLGKSVHGVNAATAVLVAVTVPALLQYGMSRVPAWLEWHAAWAQLFWVLVLIGLRVTTFEWLIELFPVATWITLVLGFLGAICAFVLRTRKYARLCIEHVPAEALFSVMALCVLSLWLLSFLRRLNNLCIGAYTQALNETTAYYTEGAACACLISGTMWLETSRPFLKEHTDCSEMDDMRTATCDNCSATSSMCSVAGDETKHHGVEDDGALERVIEHVRSVKRAQALKLQRQRARKCGSVVTVHIMACSVLLFDHELIKNGMWRKSALIGAEMEAGILGVISDAVCIVLMLFEWLGTLPQEDSPPEPGAGLLNCERVLHGVRNPSHASTIVLCVFVASSCAVQAQTFASCGVALCVARAAVAYVLPRIATCYAQSMDPDHKVSPVHVALGTVTPPLAANAVACVCMYAWGATMMM